MRRSGDSAATRACLPDDENPRPTRAGERRTTRLALGRTPSLCRSRRHSHAKLIPSLASHCIRQLAALGSRLYNRAPATRTTAFADQMELRDQLQKTFGDSYTIER